jgi:hypothetical protein
LASSGFLASGHALLPIGILIGRQHIAPAAAQTEVRRAFLGNSKEQMEAGFVRAPPLPAH